MAIPFNDIPNTLRVPFAYVEFDNSRAQQGPAIQPYETLLFGPMLSGTAVAEVPVNVTSEGQARTLFGAGSVLFGMYKAYFLNDKVTPVTVIPQADTGTPALGTVTTAAGVATETGVVALYIGGVRVPVPVAIGDDQDDVTAAIVAAIQAEDELYVSAAIDGGNPNEADLTMKQSGEFGNQLDVRLNFLDSDSVVAGLGAITVAVPMAGGATNPDVDDVIAAMPETQFNIMVNPYLDSTNRGKLEIELDDRWGPIRQIDGVVAMSLTDSLSNLTTLGNSENSKHFSILGARGPTPSWEWSSAYGGQMAKSGQADPAKPFQTLQLVGILPPDETEKFSLLERNQLLFDGIATFTARDAVRIERAITTWQTNDAGQADTSYLDVNTLLTLSFLRFSFRTRMLTKYSRHKLANDGTRFGPGQQVITPLLGKAEAVALFAEWETAGLVEGADQFKRDLIVERNSANPTRLDFLLPPDLVNQLRVVGAQIQFLL